MSLIHGIRRRSERLARASAGLFVLVWLSLAAAPCVMAMHMDTAPDHDCPHCPPTPCHEMTPDDCDDRGSPDALRAPDTNPTVLAPPATIDVSALAAPTAAIRSSASALPPARAGPRAHLLHAQFNE